MAGVQERCPVLQSAGLRRASQRDQVRLRDRRRCHPRLFLRSRFHGRRPIINSEEEPLYLSTSYFSKTPLSTLGVLTGAHPECALPAYPEIIAEPPRRGPNDLDTASLSSVPPTTAAAEERRPVLYCRRLGGST